MKGDPKPKRYRGPKRGHVIELNGCSLTVSIVCGLRYYFSPQFPQLAARFDGADDERACDAIDFFERLALGRPPVGDTKERT
jgi:hypothetical protein